MAGQIDQIVSVTITANAATPQKPNFGTPAILTYHTHFTDRIRTYTSLAGMVTDGCTTSEPAYRLATTIFEQNPAPIKLKWIRGTTSVVQTFTFVVTDNTNGDVVGLSITSPAGVTPSMYVTVASQTTPQIATALALLVPSGVTASPSSSTVTFTVTATGAIWYPSLINGGTYADTTPTASPADDLTAAIGVDSDWYGISGEHQDETNITAIATWAETNKKFHAYTSADSADTGSGTGVGHSMKVAGNTYTFGQYSKTPITYGGTGIMASSFVYDPGTATMAFKQIAGTAVDTLTDTQIANLTADNMNYYVSTANVNVTMNGVMASGMYGDLRRGIDALAAQIQIQVFALLVNTPKVAYDPAGISMVGAEVQSALNQFIPTPFSPAALLRNDPGFQPVVSLPLIANTTAVDRAARILRNVNFVAYAQNAVQTVRIVGTINV